jgi:recombinational DNA repair ATPase RecF
VYVSKIQITNFRNFKNEEIIFNDGMNVIIGQIDLLNPNF